MRTHAPVDPRGGGGVPAITEDSVFLIGHQRPRVPALPDAENPPKQSEANIHCSSERDLTGTKV